jgi:hypothetical protein
VQREGAGDARGGETKAGAGAADAPDAHFIEVRCDDVLEACAALPADPVTERLERACPAVVPTRNRRNAPAAQRIWLGEKDLAHLLSGA